MRRMRLIAAAAALLAAGVSASAHERCGCEHGLVLNGKLNTYDFDGGVGDRFGDGGAAYGGGYAIAYGGGGAFAGGYVGASASASASASAFASVSISTRIGSFHDGSGMHGGSHGGGMHGGYGGHH